MMPFKAGKWTVPTEIETNYTAQGFHFGRDRWDPKSVNLNGLKPAPNSERPGPAPPIDQTAQARGQAAPV